MRIIVAQLRLGDLLERARSARLRSTELCADSADLAATVKAMPKTPEEVKEQIDAANEERPADSDDSSLKAEGLKVPNPGRGDFLSNLEKVSTTEQ